MAEEAESIRRLVAPDSGGRLDRILAAALPELSRSRIQALIKEGRVRVDGALAQRPSEKPPPGAQILLDEPPPVPAAPLPEAIPVPVLYQDADLAVVVKPAGLVVHPAPGHYSGTLVNAMLHALDSLSGVGGVARPGIVHRLDKGTSGVMVVAKNDLAHRHLQVQFADHSIERRYRALVYGAPALDAGRIVSWLGRDPHHRLRFASLPEEASGGKRAVTGWSVLRRWRGAALIECQLETGRTHQIRVHLSEAGTPVMCDPLYGRGRTPPAAAREPLRGVDHQLLHAWVLGFEHPRTGARLRFSHPPPEDFQRALAALDAG